MNDILVIFKSLARFKSSISSAGHPLALPPGRFPLRSFQWNEWKCSDL